MPLYWLYDARLERLPYRAGLRVEKIETAPVKPRQSVIRQQSGTARPRAAIFEFLHGLGRSRPYGKVVTMLEVWNNVLTNIRTKPASNWV